MYIRNVLEQSCVVWHSSLTEEDKIKLERVQKASLRIIMSDAYLNYENALQKLNLETLDQRRMQLCEKFAKSCLKSTYTSNMFPVNVQYNQDRIQKQSENYKVQFARTERLKVSAIPYMQRLLNSEGNKI